MSKTYTGGYRLVSLAFVDLALAVTAVAVAGLGDALGVKSRKRVVLTDIVVSGEKKNDLSVQVKKDGNNYVIENVYGYDLEIVTSGSTLKATPHEDRITASDIDSGSATAGQVLTADGSGGVAFANPSGGTKLYKHTPGALGRVVAISTTSSEYIYVTGYNPNKEENLSVFVFATGSFYKALGFNYTGTAGKFYYINGAGEIASVEVAESGLDSDIVTEL